MSGTWDAASGPRAGNLLNMMARILMAATLLAGNRSCGSFTAMQATLRAWKYRFYANSTFWFLLVIAKLVSLIPPDNLDVGISGPPKNALALSCPGWPRVACGGASQPGSSDTPPARPGL